ncbi:hypothetical protein KEM48_008109 [Puccinia striiformis f. sp. tritici PST-130]|nr:hypothetical protein KEM48_008109 [Puccinia striiformis f. sp. tritici PST-130]
MAYNDPLLRNLALDCKFEARKLDNYLVVGQYYTGRRIAPFEGGQTSKAHSFADSTERQERISIPLANESKEIS